MIKLMTLVMVLSMPLTALATDAIDEKLALRCTESLFINGLDGVLESYPGIAYPSTWQQGKGVYSYESRYDVSQTKRGKNELCANYYGFVRPSQVSGNGKQANCKTNITGIKVILKSKKGTAEPALKDHQPFVCYFKGDSGGDSDSYHFHSAWTAELLRP
jgi:hypothetical protein